MAYQPDDDRFYDSLNRAGQTYLNQRGKVAEDQAATTREIGASNAQALTGTVNGVMTGAKWAQDRAAQQQQMDQAQTSEQRAQQKFAEDQQDKQHARNLQSRQEAYEAAPAEESFAKGAGVDFQPGMTHKQVEQMAGANHLGFEGKKLTSEESRARATLEGENKRAAAAQLGDNTRSQAGIDAANQRQQLLLAFDREKLAAENDREKLKLAGQKPKVPTAIALTKFGVLDDADKAIENIAEDYKTHTGRFSGVMQMVPGSDAKKYNDSVEANAQIVAGALKGEKESPSPADIEYAKELLPSAGDSTDRAELKLNTLSQIIANKKKSHAQALAQGGEDIGSIGIDASGVGKKHNLRDKTAPNQAVAAPTGPDFQKRLNAASTKPLKPVNEMTDEEVDVELAMRRGAQ